MKAWLQNQWRAAATSYDVTEALAGSQPAAVVGAAGALVSVFAVLGYVPIIAKDAQLQAPHTAIGLALLGGFFSYLAYKRGCQGRIGTVATFADNGFYSAALTYAAVNTSDSYALGLAISHGMMVLAFPAQAYGLTLMLALVLLAPLLMGLGLYSPSPTITVILICTYLMALVLSLLGGRRRELIKRQAKLQKAVGAATQIADESVQAALATTLLSLGHFLHELRNYQTAIRANLSYIAMSSELDSDAREALEDALSVQKAEEQLVSTTVDRLRERATPNGSTFMLGEVLDSAAEKGLVHIHDRLDADFVVVGVADHLAGVLTNLTRNAEQAGAKTIHIDVALEPSGQAIELVVHDDGPGIPEDKRGLLFEPFFSSGNPTGTGLGLYLCRRYIELFGGTITVGSGQLGGAAFVIQLPGSVSRRSAASASA